VFQEILNYKRTELCEHFVTNNHPDLILIYI